VTAARPQKGAYRPRLRLCAVVGLGLLAVTVLPLGHLGGPAAGASSSPLVPAASLGASVAPAYATSIAEMGSAPSSAGVGRPVAVAWEALESGVRVTTFAVGCSIAVEASANGSSVRAWVNSSTFGPIPRAANGTFSVPAAAWNGGVLDLTFSFATAVPTTIRLFGGSLPSIPVPIAMTALPDREHLELYEPENSLLGARSNDTYWHVRDPFGNPTPGAFLIVEYSSATSDVQSFVPVNWSSGGTTGAWVNYSAPGLGNGTVRVMDGANSTLLGPIEVPALATPAPPATASLSLWVLLAVALLTLGGVVGVGALVFGGRARPTSASSDGEEELRHLAEGRASIVELVREAGSLRLGEIEAAWDPPPAPPAVADWVASLVTDGTLTATLGEGGRARFALAGPRGEEPKVTLDEDALQREIARRDAAADPDDDLPR